MFKMMYNSEINEFYNKNSAVKEWYSSGNARAWCNVNYCNAINKKIYVFTGKVKFDFKFSYETSNFKGTFRFSETIECSEYNTLYLSELLYNKISTDFLLYIIDYDEIVRPTVIAYEIMDIYGYANDSTQKYPWQEEINNRNEVTLLSYRQFLEHKEIFLKDNK